ncbi:MAG: hypothetical protein V3V08_25250 [Nannocystaceae bacterium]
MQRIRRLPEGGKVAVLVDLEDEGGVVGPYVRERLLRGAGVVPFRPVVARTDFP